MARIVIIGGGFAGLSAARVLSGVKNGPEVILIDKKKSSDFLPLLPDCFGRMINPEFLRYDLEAETRRLGIAFLNQEVLGVDLDKRLVWAGKWNLPYDYLLIASGSESNFYGNDNLRKVVFTLDGAEDARRVLSALDASEFDNYVVAGGGYTGVESAFGIRMFLNRRGRKGRVVIVEKSGALLGALPQWMRSYVSANLKKMEIEVLCGSSVQRVEKEGVHISGGIFVDKALVLWSAGVKTAPFIEYLPNEKNLQGRLKCDEFLRVNERCFVAGDTAWVKLDKGALRMSVQFALTGGKQAAENILRDMRGRKLVKYRPVDLGYVLPAANGSSCGMVMGIKVKGWIATFLHLFMCFYRLKGMKNRMGMIKDIFKEG